MKLIAMLVLVSFALLLVACKEEPKAGSPALPPGFEAAPLPDADLSAYVYVNQGSPFTIPLDEFAGPSGSRQGTSSKVLVDQVASWTGSDLESFGGSVDFSSTADADTVVQLLQSRQEPLLWFKQEGDKVSFVYGDNDWARSLRTALEGGSWVVFSEKYPDTWETMRLLPVNPPGKAVAAGFVRVSQELLDSLGAKAEMDMGGIAPALGMVQIGQVAVVAYSDKPLELASEITPEFLREQGLGAVAVARSGYPGFIFSFFMGRFSGQAGLEDVTVGDEKALYTSLDGEGHLLVKNQGNTLFVAIAPAREKAEALLLAAIGK